MLGLAWGRSTIHMAAGPGPAAALHGRAADGRVRRRDRRARLGGGRARAAQVSGGDAHPIYAPMLLPDEATAEALRHQTGIARAFEYFDKVTVACVLHRVLGAGISHGARHAQRRGTGALTPPSASPRRCPRTSSTRRGAGRPGPGGAVHHGQDRQLRRVPESWRSRARSARARDRRRAALGLVTAWWRDTSPRTTEAGGDRPRSALNRTDPDGP
ncbi:hypothetical protein GCM10023238_27120 [Streptomyces heliomycini]